MAPDRPIPVLLGCTASGKSDAAMAIALEHGGLEIVSADSRQIYRGMDIGTAKPSVDDMDSVPHHMIDLLEPSGVFSAGDYARMATDIIRDIRARSLTPLVVGGSGLYILALTGGLDDLPGRDDTVRRRLREIERETPGFLARFLRAMDPSSAVALSPGDVTRTIRAIEIGLLSGRGASELRTGGARSRDTLRESFRLVGMETGDRPLRERIESRVARMLERGLVEEVRGLYLGEGYGRDNSILGSTIGYVEIMDYLDGRCDLEQARSSIVTNTWQLSRRQLRMFRKLGAVHWTRERDPSTLLGLLGPEED